MRKQLRLMKLCWALAALLLLAVPTIASAHENIGDDELAVANWMLVGALVAILTGVFMGWWAIRSGQFNNVEESKFTMLDNAEDYEAIMAESDAREAALLAEEQRTTRPQGTKAANPTPGASGGAAATPTGI
ncbi:MAG: cbb3-type cytochrome oxidase assembly protein [Chloroflexota bacterium]|nr:cbb3-type cytochrome oxidase assembly protein [Chloroflexota bacterium]